MEPTPNQQSEAPAKTYNNRPATTQSNTRGTYSGPNRGGYRGRGDGQRGRGDGPRTPYQPRRRPDSDVEEELVEVTQDQMDLITSFKKHVKKNFRMVKVSPLRHL